MTSTHSDGQTIVHQDTLDDIFGSSPPRGDGIINDQDGGQGLPREQQQAALSGNVEPSDLPSLRRQHVTAGYRDGVAESKGQHIQAGFDAGYAVGARLGMRAGTVIGILEGIVRGYDGKNGTIRKQQPGTAGESTATTEAAKKTRQEKREEILRRYRAAVRELDMHAVFAGSDTPTAAPLQGDEKSEKPEVQLGARGDAVVAKWETQVNVPLWEANMDTLEMTKE
ncbi:hypothetical protein ASPZODRAFT_71843 [Penicilliopsis zonata CBS 506.65]|uniref:Protein YAE1 n=1 Tax=Penicilliopsis zonata CBS 506.65 TaxID=1073090 RepID=A0A1L9SAR7_9EURO|nr:hypothetical protein ASPZODRAFT_71843 [Penicilliopsis zonata CBS 506.65]OJJ44248.1 hypothetical protein ASPZODRAFT_71843 [Penicilliopsis zonata CBS 506.65]